MNTSKDNVQLMIEAFTDFREGDDHSEKATDNLLRTLLDHSKVPSYQHFLEEDMVNHGKGVSANDVRRDFDANPKTDAEQSEIDEMNRLLCGGGTGFRGTKIEGELWTSHDDLMALITTYPPVVLEQLLITGFVIYLMRADGVDFDSDTDAFNEFYLGWGSVVRGG